MRSILYVDKSPEDVRDILGQEGIGQYGDSYLEFDGQRLDLAEVETDFDEEVYGFAPQSRIYVGDFTNIDLEDGLIERLKDGEALVAKEEC